MKKLCVCLILAFVLPGHSFEIRYKWISFGTDLSSAFQSLIGPLPDTLDQKHMIDSLVASSPCAHKDDSTVEDCWARGVHYYTRTPYQCCLIRTLGTRIDSLNTSLSKRVSQDKAFRAAQKNLQISEHAIIREREYVSTLYFNSNFKFYGYIVYSTYRSFGDNGTLDDLATLYKFMSDKYGTPLTHRTQVVLPVKAGGKFEYAVWNQQNCSIKVSIVSDGHQRWVQESVLNKTFSPGTLR